MSRSVKCPLHEQENLNLDSQDPPENLGKTGIPALERRRQVAPGTHWPVTLASVGVRLRERPCLKNYGEGARGWLSS